MARATSAISADEDLLEIEFRDADWLAAVVAAAGLDALVLDPPELLDRVRGLLSAAAGQISEPTDEHTAGPAAPDRPLDTR